MSASIGLAERRVRAAEMLADLGMPLELADRAPPQLSGGQRQRVNIGRALCLVPKLLVADEIVSGLDVSVQAQLLALLVRLRTECGFALLLISHDLAVMRNGSVVEAGRTDDVFANPQRDYTRELLASVPNAGLRPAPLALILRQNPGGPRVTWQPELDELNRRRAFSQQMGGADKVKRQHDGGRLTVRER
ncbi:MAG: ATP-binding cassette domain-containing protein, partial [Acetobacteraceae bacterium]|nr:ATP-binding cassette domain-containing protein [Acetobacteraceae bacterium]